MRKSLANEMVHTKVSNIVWNGWHTTTRSTTTGHNKIACLKLVLAWQQPDLHLDRKV